MLSRRLTLTNINIASDSSLLHCDSKHQFLVRSKTVRQLHPPSARVGGGVGGGSARDRRSSSAGLAAAAYEFGAEAASSHQSSIVSQVCLPLLGWLLYIFRRGSRCCRSMLYFHHLFVIMFLSHFPTFLRTYF